MVSAVSPIWVPSAGAELPPVGAGPHTGSVSVPNSPLKGAPPDPAVVDEVRQ